MQPAARPAPPPRPQAKELLEDGVLLHRPLLQQLVAAAASFVTDCGLVRYNRFALPLLTFVRKCVGIGPEEFDAMAEAAGLQPVLYDEAAIKQRLLQQQSQPREEDQHSAAAGGSIDGEGGGGDGGQTSRPRLSAAATASTVGKGSRLASGTGAASRNGSAAGAVSAGAASGSSPAPIGPIDMALAAAAKQIGEAIATARRERPQSGAGARLPGVARPAALPAAAFTAGAPSLPEGGVLANAGSGGADGEAECAVGGVADWQATADEPLPDLRFADEGVRTHRLRTQRASSCGWEGPAAPAGGEESDED